MELGKAKIHPQCDPEEVARAVYEVMPERLRQARSVRGILAEELAEAAEIGGGASAISQIENGSRRCSLEKFIRMAKVLNVSSDYLLGQTDDDYPAQKDCDEILSRYGRLEASDQQFVRDMIWRLMNKGEEVRWT